MIGFLPAIDIPRRRRARLKPSSSILNQPGRRERGKRVQRHSPPETQILHSTSILEGLQLHQERRANRRRVADDVSAICVLVG